MSDLSAPKRARIWRIAFLMAGSTDDAERVLRGILRSRHDLRKLDLVNLDRLVLQHTRELLGNEPRVDLAGPSAGKPADNARSLFREIQSLRRQCLEAWVLTEIERLDDIHVARAMDCSRTAAQRYLESAREQLRRRVDDLEALIPELQSTAAELNADEHFDRARARVAERRRQRLVTRWLAIALSILAGLAALLMQI